MAEEELNAIGTIPAGAYVTFKSGNIIKLESGFTAGSYANFSASMEFCSD